MKALLRISTDVVTKAPRTRGRFTRRLVENLRAALSRAGLAAQVTRDHVRVYLEAEDPRALDVARRVFGVHSISPCLEEALVDRDALVERGVALFADRVAGKRFAVRAKVRGVGSFGSQEVNETLGAALAERGKVDLTHPEITVQVEVRGGRVRYFTDTLSGFSGLPVGVEGRAVLLLSGGFDSAVAAWLALRRGTALDYVFCRLGGAEHERAVQEVANLLTREWGAGARARLFVVPFEPVADLIIERVSERMRQLVLKKLMYSVAESIARMVKAEAIFTGESLGQVSSQTLRNLRALGQPASMPVLRPLLGFTKEEIIARAREIGTHDLCSGVPEYCALVPRRPATGSTAVEVDRSLEAMPFDPREAARLAVRLRLPAELPPESAGKDRTKSEEIETAAAIPEGAVVLDMRPKALFEASHLPGAVLFDPSQVTPEMEDLDPDQTYVVVCEFGMRSAWLAQHMRRLGLTAFNLRGGYPGKSLDTPRGGG